MIAMKRNYLAGRAILVSPSYPHPFPEAGNRSIDYSRAVTQQSTYIKISVGK